MLRVRFFCWLFLIVLSGNLYSSDLKIGIIDMERVTKESEVLQDISNKINAKQSELGELIRANNELYKEKEDWEKQRTLMKESDYEAKMNDFDRIINENQQHVQDINYMNQMAHNKFMEAFDGFIKDAARDLREDAGVHLIFPTNYALAHDDSLDVTKDFQKHFYGILESNNVNFDQYYKDISNVSE